MPRSRGSEMPQRPSPRGPAQLRTSSSDSDPVHHRPVTNRSPKLGDRKSPRGTVTNSVNQKKIGTRIANLETQLGQAQEELKILKEQLASAEAAKKEAQEKLEKKIKIPVVLEPKNIKEKNFPQIETQEFNQDDGSEIHDDNQQATDVFEVPVEKVEREPKVDFNQWTEQEDFKMKPASTSTELTAISEQEKMSSCEFALKNDEINILQAKLEQKEKELEAFCQENDDLKKQLNEASLKISAAQSKEQEMSASLNQLEQELEARKTNMVQLNEKLEIVEQAKEAMETEMKKLTIQTEQWRKAADAAAEVLAGDAEMNERRISERCGSMDKHFASMYEPVGAYTGFVGSPGLGDDGFGAEKRKNSGIRMFGDLWRKKGQK